MANDALQLLCQPTSLDDETDQSIIISGESGSGKTESSKQVIHYLIEADTANYTEQELQTLRDTREIGAKIKNALVQSNYIFEAFGNAKTVRNDNSSRFGKYIKLQYTGEDHLVAAYSETFLLEKSRLITLNPGERSYHIFYQLFSDVEHPTLDRSVLRLTSPTHFYLLNSGQCTTLAETERDMSDFCSVLLALESIGVSESEMTSLWSILSAILHMSNCSCQAQEEEGTLQPCVIDSPSMPFDDIASILGVATEDLTKALTLNLIQAAKRSSISVKVLPPSDVLYAIRAVMKYIYSAVFSWLQRKMNYALLGTTEISMSTRIEKFIGILDIFGFEILQTNYHEQMLINYANEQLQQQFNESIFVHEQEEYRREGLQWENITFRDNQDVIDLLVKKPTGLLPILEGFGMLNRKPDDSALVASFTKQISNPCFEKSRFGTENFIVKHFAGTVEYCATGFILKNNDSLHEDLVNVLRGSNNNFLLHMTQLANKTAHGDGYVPPLPQYIRTSLSRIVEDSTALVEKDEKGIGNKMKRMAATNTVSHQFCAQLDSLMYTLRNTKTHYIKCIKPNSVKQPGVFAAPEVMHQLRCNGVLEVVRIKREGYPIHYSFNHFYETYALLSFGKNWRAPSDCSAEEAKEIVSRLAATALSPDTYQLGTHMIFLKVKYADEVKLAMKRMYDRIATVVQSKYRGYAQRTKYLRFRHRVVIVQRECRKCIYMKKYMHAKACVLKLQTVYRCHSQREKYITVLRSIALLQRAVRGWRSRSIAESRRASVITIQCFVRRFRAVAVLCKLRIAARTKLQLRVSSLYRMTVLRRRYQSYVRAVTVIASSYRCHLAMRVLANAQHAAIIIQTACRKRLAKKEFRKRQRAACAARWQAIRNAKLRKLKEMKSAVIIQIFFRRVCDKQPVKCVDLKEMRVEAYVRSFVRILRKRMDERKR